MKKFIEICAFIVFIGSVLLFFKVFLRGIGGDFQIYYLNAKAISQGLNPYLLTGSFIGGYIYPPMTLFFFYPLIGLPFIVAGTIWKVFSILCFFLGLWLLIKPYKQRLNRSSFLILGACALNYFPAKYTLGMGQFNTVLFLITILGINYLRQKKQAIAGLFFGFSLVLKYMPVLILMYSLIQRQWKVLFYASACILSFFGVGFIIFGYDTLFYFFTKVLFPAMISSAWDYYYNQALSGFLLRDFSWMNLNQILLVRLIVGITMLLISILILLKNKNRSKLFNDLALSTFLSFNIIINTFSDQHHFIFVLIPLFFTYLVIQSMKFRVEYYFVLIFVFLLTAGNLASPLSFPLFFQSHAFYGVSILWIFDMYLLWNNISKNNIK